MRIIINLAVVLFAATFAFADLKPESSQDDILDGLYNVGKDLKSFTADVKLTESDAFSQDSWARLGKVWYQQKSPGDSRLRVNFTTRIQDNTQSNQQMDYLLDKGWLVDRNYTRKLEVNRQVLRPGEKINLLKLGEGPFPLPIGQKKEDVLRMFDVKKIAKAPDDPANTVHLKLTPRPNTQFERKFAVIEVWVDCQSIMPRRILTEDKNQTMTRGTDLDNVRLNVDIPDADFALPPIPATDWQRRDEPFDN